MNDEQRTERVVFVEEIISGSHVRLIASGEIDASLLDGLSAFIARRRRVKAIDDLDGDWAE